VLPVTAPETWFGHQLGADRKIARWDRIVDYFYQLDKESDRIQVSDLGPSTEGNPFLLAIISSPNNLKNLEELRQINLQITDPRGQTEAAIKQLTQQGKVVILQTMSLHASEIGGTQMAPELAYDLLSGEDEDTERILENVIFLMVPCFNPDGQQMVTDWYNRWLGTEYEGCSMPWLYHKYAGHDNNRDAFMQNLVESQYVGRLLLRDWRPQAYQDHHHMGSYGARLYVSPYSDPIRPHADPLIWRELSWYGAHMAYKLEEKGKTGILNGAQFPGWGHFGFHWLTNHHNIAGMLTESASAKLATPLYIQSSQLSGADKRTLPEYAPQTNFPHPWPGGWWRLRDIVEQQKISAWALLDVAARNKETILWNAYQKAKRQTDRGARGPVKAYVIDAQQHDPLTVRKLVQVLLNQGVEVHQAAGEMRVGKKIYSAGSYVVLAAQPKLGVIRVLLEETRYPNTYWSKHADGTTAAFDTATDTVAEYMGVHVHASQQIPDGELKAIEQLSPVHGQVAGVASHGYLLDARQNDTYRAVNLLLKHGVQVDRCTESIELDGRHYPPGMFVVPKADQVLLQEIAQHTGVDFVALAERRTDCTQPVQAQRVGLFQRYYGGNADEGWTRLILERFDFAYETVMDTDIKAGNLKERFDVLVFPSDWKQLIVDISQPDKNNPRGAAMFLRWFGDTIPDEYKSGIGQEGIKALREFVQAGGRLVAMNNSCEFAAEVCGLKVKNVVAGLSATAYQTHGSTLRVEVDTDHRLGYGMPQEAWVLNWNSPVLQVTDTFHAENYHVVARYPEKNVLKSGLLMGEEHVVNKSAMIAAKCGHGEVVLIAFAPQHRGQMHGTFKVLFNCLYY
jgi:hypothetical protein